MSASFIYYQHISHSKLKVHLPQRNLGFKLKLTGRKEQVGDVSVSNQDHFSTM